MDNSTLCVHFFEFCFFITYTFDSLSVNPQQPRAGVCANVLIFSSKISKSATYGLLHSLEGRLIIFDSNNGVSNLNTILLIYLKYLSIL